MVHNDRPRSATPVRRPVVILLSLVLVALAASPPATSAVESSISPGNWPRLRLPDPVGHRVAGKALDLAWDRLATADCADLFTVFKDRAGRPLDDRLRELAVDRQTYLTMLHFVDGSRDEPCVKGSFAFTTPGSRVVRICIQELKRTWQANPEYAVSRVIHEMLHTLGLGENPPSSDEITRRVLAGCGR
jgi:hypothetical protein